VRWERTSLCVCCNSKRLKHQHAREPFRLQSLARSLNLCVAAPSANLRTNAPVAISGACGSYLDRINFDFFRCFKSDIIVGTGGATRGNGVQRLSCLSDRALTEIRYTGTPAWKGVPVSRYDVLIDDHMHEDYRDTAGVFQSAGARVFALSARNLSCELRAFRSTTRRAADRCEFAFSGPLFKSLRTRPTSEIFSFRSED
jgi:hypothetical protein